MKAIKEDAERDLLESIRQGDENAFCFMYNRYANMLFSYGIKIVKNKEIVDEAIQILFTDFYVKRKNIKIQKSIHSYLCVCLRRIINKIRNKESSVEFVDSKHVDILSLKLGYEIDPETTLISVENRKELLYKINNAVESLLTEQQKEVVYLKYYKNLSNCEISEILGLNSQIIRNVSYRALSALRKKWFTDL